MKIGLDLRTIDEKGGIGRYTKRVYEELLKINNNLFYPYPSSESLDIHFNNNLDFSIELPISQVELANKYLAFIGGMNDFSVFYSPYHPLPANAEFKTVMTIHDLIPIIFPNLTINDQMHHFFRNEIKEAAESASIIIADSEATKRDICQIYNIDRKKIKVVYLGCDIDRTIEPTTDILKLFDINEYEYILSVSTLEPRKNLKAVIEAFEQIKNDRKSIKLVLVGALGWKYDELLERASSSLYSQDIIITGFVNDQQLVSLYKYASVFLYPSFYEGFGLPVLEAMSYGTPVVTSNTSSLPEVGGNACLYCNPNDVLDIATHVDKVLNDDNLKHKLSVSGMERAQLFTWEKTARQIYDILINI